MSYRESEGFHGVHGGISGLSEDFNWVLSVSGALWGSERVSGVLEGISEKLRGFSVSFRGDLRVPDGLSSRLQRVRGSFRGCTEA